MYTKCLHGIYDVSVCSICTGLSGTEEPVFHNPETELIKDPPWSGIGVSHPESTALWNQPPKLKTSEQIWDEYCNPETYRLSNSVYEDYLVELDAEEIDQAIAEEELADVPELFRPEYIEVMCESEDEDAEV